jgi:hypothetical protein
MCLKYRLLKVDRNEERRERFVGVLLFFFSIEREKEKKKSA